MTRDEQMWEAVAQEHGDLSMRDALVTLTAMEWADKTMIDKACEWLKKHFAPAGFVDGIFRKAMLEEE